MEELRKQFKEAINSFDFDRAEQIDRSIQELASGRSCTYYETQSKFESDGYVESKKNLIDRIEEIHNIYKNKIEEIKSDYSLRCNTLDNDFKRRANCIENDYQCELRIAQKRVSPEGLKLQRESIILGKARDFQKARETYQESLKLNGKAAKEAVIIVEEKYKDIRLRNELQRKDEINGCLSKQDSALKEIENKYELELEKLRKRLKAIQTKYHYIPLPGEAEKDEQLFRRLIINYSCKSKSRASSRFNTPHKRTTSEVKENDLSKTDVSISELDDERK